MQIVDDAEQLALKLKQHISNLADGPAALSLTLKSHDDLSKKLGDKLGPDAIAALSPPPAMGRGVGTNCMRGAKILTGRSQIVSGWWFAASVGVLDVSIGFVSSRRSFAPNVGLLV